VPRAAARKRAMPVGRTRERRRRLFKPEMLES
jgi:hypothetical protein